MKLTNDRYVIYLRTKTFTEKYARDAKGWYKISARQRRFRMTAEQVLNHLLPALAGVKSGLAVEIRHRDARPARTQAKPKLLSGGNPQIAKADGDAPVQAYIAAMPGWKHDMGKRLDALIVRNVPNVRKAVRWNSPFYGLEEPALDSPHRASHDRWDQRVSQSETRRVKGLGWFLSFHVFTRYVKVTFFRGTSLRPVPPGPSKHKEVRYLDIHEDDLDEAQMVSWVKQAAALPGWVP
jgi:hypothetical protein